MKLKIVNFLIGCVIFTSCNNNSSLQDDKIPARKSRLSNFEVNLEGLDQNSEIDFLTKELSLNYSKKFTCDLDSSTRLIGDLNEDGISDILYRYTVNDIENQTWVACGWIIVFKNKADEFENYQLFDWSSGRCAKATMDFGIPTKIENGIIYSEIDDYDFDAGDACCCPSIHRKMTFTYNKELNFLDLLNATEN